jgi:hypothetical protein
MLGVVACEECGGVAPASVVRNSDHTYSTYILFDARRHIYVYIHRGVRVLVGTFTSVLLLTFQQKVLLHAKCIESGYVA